jgi:hypothetical protein
MKSWTPAAAVDAPCSNCGEPITHVQIHEGNLRPGLPRVGDGRMNMQWAHSQCPRPT